MSSRFAAQLVVTVTPSDVGERVSLRRALPSGEFSDVVGVLESWSEGVLTVRRRTGEIARVPEGIVVAGKVVPPAPPRRAANRSV
ncbi:hypothetical protein GCM10027589_05620 [Actinocorallia lasiicapitis]